MAAEHGGYVVKADFSQIELRVLSEVRTVTSERYSCLSSSSCTVLSQHLADEKECMHPYTFVLCTTVGAALAASSFETVVCSPRPKHGKERKKSRNHHHHHHRLWLYAVLATPDAGSEVSSGVDRALFFRCSLGDAQLVVCGRGSRSLRAADAELSGEWHPRLRSSRPALQLSRLQCKTS